MKSCASSSPFSHALTTSGRAAMRSCRIAKKPPSFSWLLAPEATRRASPSWIRREVVGSHMIAASILPARKLEVITSMFWFRYSFGSTFDFLNVAWPKRSVQLPFGTATVLPSSHLIGSSASP